MIDHPQLGNRERTSKALTNLMSARPIEDAAVVVAAHPDDEMLAMAGRLATLKNLTVVQLTDGAPRSNVDARRAGFCRREHYAAERENETLNALAVLGLDCRRIRAGVPDQESLFFIPRLLRMLECELQDTALVFTHPYEGGHPDHDTAALVVQLTCDLIRSKGGTPPARLEFASYHHRSGELVTGRFWPDHTCLEIAVALEEQAAKTKCRALAEYRTQETVIQWFQPRQERYRAAPRYDFAQPPPPGLAQYDLFGWSMTAARWRDIAAMYSVEARS
jgi:LmbE family N-acetylglucosaminyl deacetylase